MLLRRISAELLHLYSWWCDDGVRLGTVGRVEERLLPCGGWWWCGENCLLFLVVGWCVSS